MNMGKLRIGHLVEAGLWLSLCLFLYVYSFEFDRDIEILQVRCDRLAADHYSADGDRRNWTTGAPLVQRR